MIQALILATLFAQYFFMKRQLTLTIFAQKLVPFYKTSTYRTTIRINKIKQKFIY